MPALGAGLALVALRAPPTAFAQTTGTNTGTATTSLAAADFLVELWRRDGEKDWTRLSTFESQYFFNRARCECDEPVRITVGLSTAGAAKRGTITRGVVKVIVGQQACVSDDPASRATAKCTQVGGDLNLVGISQKGRVAVDTTVGTVFKNTAKGCDGTKQVENIRLFVDIDLNTEPDLAGEAAPFVKAELDSQPPEQPDGVEVSGGNEALETRWTSLTGIDDFGGYLVFCSRGENLPVFKSSGYKSQYHTRTTFCGAAATTGANPAAPPDLDARWEAASLLQDDIDSKGPAEEQAATEAAGRPANPRAIEQSGGAEDEELFRVAQGPFAAPTHFGELDPRYLCSGLLTTQNEARISGLQNGIPYLVGIAAVDKHGNASPIEEVFLQSPIATRDFFRGYRAAGGEAEGGFCAVAGRQTRGAVWPLAGLGLLAAALMRRRRLVATRRPR